MAFQRKRTDIHVYTNPELCFMVLIFMATLVNGTPVNIPKDFPLERFNVSNPNNLFGKMGGPGVNNTNRNVKCSLYATDTAMFELVTEVIERKAKLLQFTITFHNYSNNPLLQNVTHTYKPDVWSRVGSSHGQTILNLAFNYGVLSLMTLNFGLEKLDVELADKPEGCFGKLQEWEKMQAMVNIMLRDFDAHGDVTVFEGESSVCHQVVQVDNNYAKFTDRCCYEGRDSTDVVCVQDIPNRWLGVLEMLLAILAISIFIFGPVLMPKWLFNAAMEDIEYYIKLKEPLDKDIVVIRSRDTADEVNAKHIIDLRHQKDFRLCRKILGELPENVVIPIRIDQYDIKVCYRKLLSENTVPVGIFSSLARAIFMCKLRDNQAFKGCCDAPIFGCCAQHNPHKWIDFCSFVGRFLLAVFLPTPFYIRLAIYYLFEGPEIEARTEMAHSLNVELSYSYKLIQYLTPTHPLYITLYVIYGLAATAIAYLSGKHTRTRFQQSLVDSFADMHSLSMITSLGMLVSNCLWPFKKFGIWGIFIGIILWPILMPLSLIVCIIYCLPLIFLSIRLIVHTFGSMEKKKRLKRDDVKDLEADALLKALGSKSNIKKAKEGICYSHFRIAKFLSNIFLLVVSIATLYTIMFMVAEVVSFLAEILCFTMMGLIVNAAKVLKYGTLLFMVLMYSHDCFDNVNKKYLKLNKSLFTAVKKKIGDDLNDFCRLPSHKQHNRGFKHEEASEQDDHETPDDISTKDPRSLTINDLVLFIDQEDQPRIPKKLFDEVCAVQVSGSPGPVYKSLLQATGKFCILIVFLMFVFIVVLSFGDSYKMSSTNQMLATMAGGFMPMLFKNVLKPASADVETGLVTFTAKLEEIMENFRQDWPMNDLYFEVIPKQIEEVDEDDTPDEKVSDDAHSTFTDKSDLKLKTYPVHMSPLPIHVVNGTLGSKAPSEIVSSHFMSNGDAKSEKNGKWFEKTMEVELKQIKNNVETLDLEPITNEKDKVFDVDILIYVKETDEEWALEYSPDDPTEMIMKVTASM